VRKVAEYRDDLENLVPFEIGLQAGETIIMWALGTLFWLLSFVFMGLAVGWDFGGAFGPIMYIAGGLFLLGSQFVTRWNPIRTTRIPITGIVTWMWIVVFGSPILYKGWEVYSDSSMVWFVVIYIVLAVLITGGLMASNFLTSLKIMNWMSQDLPTTLYVVGIISTIIGISMVGFNNNALLDIEELTWGGWEIMYLFAMSFLFMLELHNGAHRFNDIIKYAKEKASGEFSLTPVINSYYIMGFILMVIIGFGFQLVLVINFFFRWITPYLSEQMANSMMMNSVYSVVFTLALIFVPLWIVLILWMEFKNRKEAEEEDAMRRKVESPQSRMQ
jgi:hypothetical protein